MTFGTLKWGSDEPYNDEETLRRLYVEEDKTIDEIADELDTSTGTISKSIRKYGFETKEYPILHDKEGLEKLYESVDTHAELADKIGCSQVSASCALLRHNINNPESICCPDCNEEFIQIGRHWNITSCEQIDLTDHEKSVLRGLLIGDGTIKVDENGKRLNYSSSVADFITFLREEFWFFTGKVNVVPEEESRLATCDHYQISTTQLDYVEKLSENYRPNSGNIFSSSLNLDPTMIKYWYIGDGCLNWNTHNGEYTSSNMKITSQHGMDNSEYIVSQFNEFGYDPSYGGKDIRFDVESTEKLLNEMGSPPPGFEYKWFQESREGYELLKKEAYSSPF